MTTIGVDDQPVDLIAKNASEIHLWCLSVSLEERSDFLLGGAELLSGQEWQRYSAMTNPDAANQFLAGRVLARRVLGKYMRQTPVSVPLFTDASGKPILQSDNEFVPGFSLSHSGGEAVLAIVGEGDIGVDIEQNLKAPAAERIANAFFTKAERQLIGKRSGDSENTALTFWTLKESIVKARNCSVWGGLRGVELTVEGMKLHWEAPPSERDSWSLVSGTFRRTHRIAIAHRSIKYINGNDPTIRCYDETGKSLPAGELKLAQTN